MEKKIKNICCIGAGYVGGPTMAVIAHKCPHLKVNVIDISEERIKSWNNENTDDIPIYEPGLSELIKKCRGKNLFFSNDIKKHIAEADMIFISVNTPTKTKGIGAGKASDLKWVESSARQIAMHANGSTIVVEKSTLPVKTAEVIKCILDAAQVNSQNKSNSGKFSVLSNPEFLAEGTAINDLINPDRILIGGEDEDSIEALSQIYNNWVPKEKILKTNIWSSELAKLTSNAFLAQRISSINSISALCEATGADIREVSRAIGTDSRIGSKFLESSPGFGGSCFKKDILNLVYLSEYFGLPEVASFWNEVVKINTWHQHRIAELITKKLFGTLSSKKIAILGFSFKSNTNDTRESAAIQICKDLIDEGAFLCIHDPKVSKVQIAKDLNCEPSNNDEKHHKDNHYTYAGSWQSALDIKTALKNSDAAVILTEWDEYSEINWDELASSMRKPAWVFDSRSVINPQNVINSGLNFWRVGDGLTK